MICEVKHVYCLQSLYIRTSTSDSKTIVNTCNSKKLSLRKCGVTTVVSGEVAISFMPVKKESKLSAEAIDGEDPGVFLLNYQKFSKTIGLTAHPGVVRTLNDVENYPVEQLVIDDELDVLGPGGTRALMTSILGTGPGMKGGPYKLLKSLRIWKSNVGDDGAAAIVSLILWQYSFTVLRLGN